MMTMRDLGGVPSIATTLPPRARGFLPLSVSAFTADLPGFAGRVHPKTATPLIATALIVAATLALALLVPFERLVEGTSLATLVVFALVNLALLRLRHCKVHTDGPHIRVPLWVPAAGLVSCLAMMAAAVAR